MRGYNVPGVLKRVRPTDKSAMLFGLAVLTASFALSPALGLELQLPIDCTPGKDCFVQNYPDVSPDSAEPQDFTCGSATFHGLTGTDIRLLSIEAAKGVKVLAAAGGTVRGARDGMADHLMRTGADKAAIAGRECGNGVVIVHGDGWETQYCHLRDGSVRVRASQKVAAGAWLGDVGQSGETQFAHIHMTVRHNGRTVDPFLGEPVGATCRTDGKADPSKSLWRRDLQMALGPPRTVVLETGFSSAAVSENTLEEGRSLVPILRTSSPELILFARIMHLAKGDRVHLRAEFPGGAPIDLTSEPETHDKAVKVIAAARKGNGSAWPLGAYRGHVDVIRDGKVLVSSESATELR